MKQAKLLNLYGSPIEQQRFYPSQTSLVTMIFQLHVMIGLDERLVPLKNLGQ
jgi:hypothetical protein